MRRASLLTLSVTVCLIAGALVAAASPAGSANPVWKIVKSPNLRVSFSSLDGVSCLSAANCYAVGNSGFQTLVEHWDGKNWSIMASATGMIAALDGVSCPSASSCYAVGFTSVGIVIASTDQPFVEHWDGKKWSIMTSPTPTGLNAVLNGVSCPSATNCYAVGGAFSTDLMTGQRLVGQSLVEHWDGRKWSIMASPRPRGVLAELGSVSCLSAMNCYAVGGYSNLSGGATLVEHWDGKKWSIMASPNPTDTHSPNLNGVSCPSTTNCYAVGGVKTSGEPAGGTLVEHWDGKKWSIMTSLTPTGLNAVLNGVSCPSAMNCYAVGGAVGESGGNGFKTLVEHWDGKKWSVMASPTPTGSPTLLGVSCPSAANCNAVGSNTRRDALIERYG